MLKANYFIQNYETNIKFQKNNPEKSEEKKYCILLFYLRPSNFKPGLRSVKFLGGVGFLTTLGVREFSVRLRISFFTSHS